jgi:hypothetical protein
LCDPWGFEGDKDAVKRHSEAWPPDIRSKMFRYLNDDPAA